MTLGSGAAVLALTQVDARRMSDAGTGARPDAEAQRRVGDLSLAGGSALASVDDIQANVPRENILAPWRAAEGIGS
jgi:hypothetical protein